MPSKQSVLALPPPLVRVSLLLVVAQVGHSLRMINLDSPQIALQGDTIHLSCLFKLSSSSKQQQQPLGQQTTATSQHLSAAGGGGEKLAAKNDDQDESGVLNELLYAIKWYKDGKEFYRYLAQDWPRKQSLPVDGIQLDVDKSDNHTIVLRSLALRSSGLYKCEVSTDAPRFITKSIERRLLVYAIPNRGPVIEMKPHKQGQLFRGDSVELVCSAPESKPPPSLDWIINDTLNLSSSCEPQNGDTHKALASEASRFFNFSSSRFVRLPSLSPERTSSSSMANTISSGQLPQTMPSSSSSSQILYLIQNGSVASPMSTPTAAALATELSPGKAPAINLTGSLDRLAEMSTTRLNFTVDANLFLYLSQLAANQLQVNSSSRASAATSRGIRQTAAAAATDTGRMESPSGGTNRTLMSRTKFKDYSRRQHGANQSSAGVNNDVTPSMQEARRKSLSPATKVAIQRRPSGVAGSMLRIRCVARVLHLSMSDEIKLNLVVDKNHNRNEAEMSDGQTNLRPVYHEAAKSDSLPRGLSDDYWTVYLITVVVSILLQSGYSFAGLGRELCPIRVIV